MDAIVVAIGDEVLRGQTINSNAAAIAKELQGLGFDVIKHVVLKDDIKQLTQELPFLAQQCQLLVTTGGLGPTTDDRTRTALIQAFGWTFDLDKIWLDHLQKNFTSPQHALISQAMRPVNSQLIQNTEGTACGFACKTKEGAVVVVLPGVPGECLAMVSLFPDLLAQYFPANAIRSATKVHFFGVYERYLDASLQEAVRLFGLDRLCWGLYPDISKVTVVLQGPSDQQALAATFLNERYRTKVFSGDLLADLVFYTQAHEVNILESITAGLMRWQASHHPDLKINFEPQLGQKGWLLTMEIYPQETHLVLAHQGEEKARLKVARQGSLMKQQKRCATLGYGLLLEFFRDGAIQVVAEPLK